MSFPQNLSGIEVLDLGLWNEQFAYRRYDRLGLRTEIDQIQARLSLLKKDEKDHRKTLRWHREDLFTLRPPSVTEEEAHKMLNCSAVCLVSDKKTLLQAFYDAIKAEEYGAYFYDRMGHRVPDSDTQVFLKVLASEGKFHVGILRDIIRIVSGLRVMPSQTGRRVIGVA